MDKQRNKTRASLHDFVVLNMNRKFYALIASSAELPEEFKDTNSVHTNFENYACTPVFFLCYPKAYNSLKPIKNGYAKSKTKGAQKGNTFVQCACEYLRNKLVEVAKVFEFTKY